MSATAAGILDAGFTVTFRTDSVGAASTVVEVWTLGLRPRFTAGLPISISFSDTDEVPRNGELGIKEGVLQIGACAF